VISALFGAKNRVSGEKLGDESDKEIFWAQGVFFWTVWRQATYYDCRMAKVGILDRFTPEFGV